MSCLHHADFAVNCTAETAAFIADQIGQLQGSAAGARRICRLAVLGLQSGCGGRGGPLQRTVQPVSGALQGVDHLRLCAQLLRHGAQLVVLDRPRNRMLIEVLLQLAAVQRSRIPGSIRLERDLSSACHGADGVLLLPGWPAERPLAWGVLADRLRPGAQVFDLRGDGASERASSCGLRLWHLGSLAALF